MKNVRRKLFWIMGVVILVAITIIVGYSNYNVQMNEKIFRQKCEYNLRVYMQFIEDAMKDVEDMLFVNAMQDENIKSIIKSETSIDRYLALMKKKKEFEKEMKKNHLLDGMFLYDDIRKTYVGSVGNYITPDIHSIVKRGMGTLVEDYENAGIGNWWTTVRLEEEYYMIRIMKIKSLYLGAWMKPEHLLEELANGEEDTGYLICSKEGTVLTPLEGLKEFDRNNIYTKINQVKYRTYQHDSQNKDISLVMLVRDNRIQILFRQIIIPVIVILSLGLIIFVLTWELVKEKVFDPIDRIMLEKTLEKNEVHLRLLQMQMNPHFLNNCLSLIRSLIVFGQYNEAEQAVMELSDYTRVSFQPDTMISVKKELAHVHSWYELQKLRMKDGIEIYTDFDKRILDEMIPTMLIQTFVENAAKHYGKPGEQIIIKLKAGYKIFESEVKYIEITIEDNGIGFSSNVLAQLQRDGIITDSRGMRHIGIKNIMERLRILYEGTAKLEIGNHEAGGARIRIDVPVKEEGEQK